MRTIEQRLHGRFVVSESGCWDWTGKLMHKGYGTLIVDGKEWRAHRLSYVVHKGEIPNAMFVCHSCDNRKCINPDHLWIGSAADNNQDAANKGRSTTKDQVGIKNLNAKLDESQVGYIRKELNSGADSHELAARYGVSYRNIRAIAVRRSWTHL